jgi:hypothetical protein
MNGLVLFQFHYLLLLFLDCLFAVSNSPYTLLAAGAKQAGFRDFVFIAQKIVCSRLRRGRPDLDLLLYQSPQCRPIQTFFFVLSEGLCANHAFRNNALEIIACPAGAFVSCSMTVVSTTLPNSGIFR